MTTLVMDPNAFAALQKKPLDELINMARLAGIEIEEDMKSNDIIRKLLEKGVTADSELKETTEECGELLAIKLRDDMDKTWIQAVRDSISVNQERKQFVQMFLKNRDNKHYHKRAPYARMQEESFKRVLEMVVAGDKEGRQEKVIKALKETPELYECVLVRVFKAANGEISDDPNAPGVQTFVMLYARPKNMNLKERVI